MSVARQLIEIALAGPSCQVTVDNVQRWAMAQLDDSATHGAHVYLEPTAVGVNVYHRGTPRPGRRADKTLVAVIRAECQADGVRVWVNGVSCDLTDHDVTRADLLQDDRLWQFLEDRALAFFF